MKLSRYTLCAAALCSGLIAGCYDPGVDDAESIESTNAALNGDTIASGGPLTRKTFAEPNESVRQANTTAYYNTVGTGSTGGGSSISSALPTLSSFITRYQFAGNEVVARYYNRGDLGIGREMHCVDRLNTSSQEIACYVRNFFGGDADKEFAFGLSSSIAFTNMAASNSFATVAMVYRNAAPANHKVFFAVYNAAGNALLPAAALDRHGFEFAAGRLSATPGVQLNNHIPTNCIACHGGSSTYTSSTRALTGALFLPFDLDQFEYENVPGNTRADQLNAFRSLNQMVRKVGALSGSAGGTVVRDQLDVWYGNTVKQTDATEVFENQFNSNALPAGWTSGTGQVAYRSVVRGFCRGCHVSQGALTFDTESQFSAVASTVVSDICNFQMPHALQTQREFWQSAAPAALEGYLTSIGATAAANTLHGCGPGNVVTLDPPLIAIANFVTMGT